MDPKVWGKLLTLHQRGYDDVEALRDDDPLPVELRNRPQDGISWIQKVAAVELGFWLLFWSFGGMRVYIGGRSMSVEHRGSTRQGGRAQGGRPPPTWPPRKLLGVESKSPGSCLVRKSRSRRFYSVWTLFDIPFIQNTEIGKKNSNSGLGLRLIG